MRFLVDMNLGVGVAEWLRDEGHDAVHLREQGRQQLPDQEVIAKAKHEDRVVVTADLDFPELVALSGDRIVSVIVFRVSSPKTRLVIDRMAHVLRSSVQALDGGAIVTVEEARHRVRLLPLGRADQ